MPERSPPDAAVDVLDVVTNAQNLQALLMRFFGYVNPAGDAFAANGSNVGRVMAHNNINTRTQLCR